MPGATRMRISVWGICFTTILSIQHDGNTRVDLHGDHSDDALQGMPDDEDDKKGFTVR
jgi:hypothetical protein